MKSSVFQSRLILLVSLLVAGCKANGKRFIQLLECTHTDRSNRDCKQNECRINKSACRKAKGFTTYCIATEDDSLTKGTRLNIQECDRNDDSQLWYYYDNGSGRIEEASNQDYCAWAKQKAAGQAVRLGKCSQMDVGEKKGRNTAWSFEAAECASTVKYSKITVAAKVLGKKNECSGARCDDLCLTYQGSSLDADEHIKIKSNIEERPCQHHPREMWRYVYDFDDY